jgi:hypothetical protein
MTRERKLEYALRCAIEALQLVNATILISNAIEDTIWCKGDNMTTLYDFVECEIIRAKDAIKKPDDYLRRNTFPPMS